MTDITELAHREKFEEWWERTQHNGNPPRFGWSHWRDGEGYKVDDDNSELDGMWSAWKAAVDELVEALEKAQQRNAELEESHAQVIQSRDHYKRISEEGLKQLAVSRTVTVKLPDLRQVVSGDRYVWSDGVFNYSQDVKAELTAKGIKWEAE